MAARAVLGPLASYVHVYFHDTDLLSTARRVTLRATLALLGRRCLRGDLEEVAERSASAPELPFADACAG
jgi:hypothetical protein